MSIKKKIFAMALAFVTITGTLGLAACGSSDNAQETNPRTLKVWYYEEATSAQGIAWKKAIESFEKKHHVTVQYEKKSFEQIRKNASQILNSDNAPDVMEYNKGNATAGLLASQGLLTNLNRYVKKYGWNTILSGAIGDTGRYSSKGVMGSGNWYGITNYGEEVLMYYNKNLFKKYGVSIPRTSAQLESAMAKFAKAGITPLSEGVKEYPLQHLWYQLVLMKANEEFIQNYQMYKGPVDWQGEAITYATKTIKKWVDEGYISKNSTGIDAESAGQGFMKGTYPMFFSGTWWFGRFQSELKNFEWTESIFPGAHKIPGSSGNIWVIPQKSRRKDLAAAFIDITMSKQIQNLMGNSGGIPVNSDVSSIKNKKFRTLVGQFNTVLKKNQLGFYPDWPTSTFYGELNSSLQTLVNGSTTVNQTIEQLKADYDKGVSAADVK